MELANFFGGPRLQTTDIGPFGLEEMRRLLPNVLSNVPNLSTETQGRRRNWLPDLDLGEDDEAYHIWVDLPGINIEDLRLDIKGNALVIKGKRKYGANFKEQLLVRERGMGKIYRVVPLFDDCDPNHINATYDNGVLHITIKKLGQQNRVTHIHVESKQRAAAAVHPQVSQEVSETIPGKEIKLPVDTHVPIKHEGMPEQQQKTTITPGMQTTVPEEQRGTEAPETGKKEFEKGKELGEGKEAEQGKQFAKGKETEKSKEYLKEGEKFKEGKEGKLEGEAGRQAQAVGSAGR